MSEESVFAQDIHKMFWFIREGFSLQSRTEGFCEELRITSEMLNGEMILDGWWRMPLSLGEEFVLKTAGEQLTLTDHKLKIPTDH